MLLTGRQVVSLFACFLTRTSIDVFGFEGVTAFCLLCACLMICY